jgi:hypothetical protein
MATKRKSKKKTYWFTESDLGSWIDGAYGSEHAIQKMEEMLGDLGTQYAENLMGELDEIADLELDEASDAYDEWLDDATTALQEETEPGLVWEWEAGDLVLRESEEDE